MLGPILFNIYLNDLFSLETRGDLLAYADDTAIVYTADTWQDLKLLVEHDFVSVQTWFAGNALTINAEKTKYLTFASYESHLPHFGTLHIGCNNNSMISSISIKEAYSTMYLGIVLDSHFRWNLHIEYTIKKITTISCYI